jgi:hypothetical protein
MSEKWLLICSLHNCFTLFRNDVDCHQSLVKLAQHNRIKVVWVPEHMGIDGKQGSSHPSTGPEPALGISGDKQAGNTSSSGCPFMDKGNLRTFLKDPLLKELGNYST